MKKINLLLALLISAFSFSQSYPVEEKTGFPDLPEVGSAESVDTPSGITYYIRDDKQLYYKDNLGNEVCLTCPSASQLGYIQSETFEESAALGNGAFEWGVGNGDEIGQNGGVASAFTGSIKKLYSHIFEGSATIELYINGSSTGQTITLSGANASTVVNIDYPVNEGDKINFRTITTSGNTNGGSVGFLSSATGAPDPFSINEASDVNVSGVTDGQVLTWDNTASEWIASSDSGGGTNESEVAAIAAGSTLGLEQSLLTNDGQPAKTVLAVAFTTSGKVQGISLGAGNVITIYENGTDYANGIPIHTKPAYQALNYTAPEFMNFGEPICFTDLPVGAIITSTQGFYGFSEQVDAGDESPMPLLSYGLSFKETFLYAFRNSQTYNPGAATANQGWIHVVNGPLSNTIKLTNGSGVTVQGQENIDLTPWQYYRLYTSGNNEYILSGTQPMMAAIAANMDSNPIGRFYDSRHIMPLSNDIVTHPRSGFVSALYNNTSWTYYVRDGATGTSTTSPGSPTDFDGVTGANDADYEPNGATRVLANGVVVAYSGADSAGLEATAALPSSAMSQVVAQPLTIADTGDGGDSGVSIVGQGVGTAYVYEYNTTTDGLDLAYTVPLNRTGVTVTDYNDQWHPTAGLVSNDTADGVVTLVGQLNPGVIIADVPIHVVVQNGTPSLVPTIRSQGGTTTTGIVTQDDETVSLGITPSDRKLELVLGADNIKYKRVINAGVETWVQY